MKKVKKKCYKCGETKTNKFSPSVKYMCRECSAEYQKEKRKKKKVYTPLNPVDPPMEMNDYVTMQTPSAPAITDALREERELLSDRIDQINKLLTLYK